MSEGDYLKWEKYYEMNVIEFMNLLGFHKDKMKKLKEEYNEAKRIAKYG